MDKAWVIRELLSLFDEFEATYYDSKDERVEMGFIIFVLIEEGEPQKAVAGKHHRGGCGSVSIHESRENAFPLGYYHTHLEETESILNETDVLFAILYKYRLVCVGEPRGLACFRIDRDSTALKAIEREMEPNIMIDEAGKVKLKLSAEWGSTRQYLLGHPLQMAWESKIAANWFEILDPLFWKKWKYRD
jgi:hypothetical protein